MKAIFICTLLLFAASLHAQFIPNSDFELWTETTQDTLPKDWATSGFGAGRTRDAAHGEYAVTIWNWYSYAKGRIGLGKKDMLEYDLINNGVPLPLQGKGTFTLSGEYKYVLGENGGNSETDDSAVVFVMLKKFNYQTQQPDTAAFTIKKLGPANAYRLFSIPIYVDRDSVDSLSVLFYSSEKGFCHSNSDGNCLYLTIDNLNYSFFEGLRTKANTNAEANAPFPNPFKDVSSFGKALSDTRLILTNVVGREVFTKRYVTGEEILVGGSTLPIGTYFYKVISADGIVNGKVIRQ
ncbi:MAG TPA: T9SS type A sorting domain-containing protein [Candidatus Kapabacteria bacterium]